MWEMTYNLLAHCTVVCDLLSLRTAELLCAGGKGFVEVVLLTRTLRIVVVVVIHRELRVVWSFEVSGGVDLLKDVCCLTAEGEWGNDAICVRCWVPL